MANQFRKARRLLKAAGKTRNKKRAEVVPSALSTNGSTSPDSPDSAGATRVGLRPRGDWHRRNFVTEVLLPSLFSPRIRIENDLPSLFPELSVDQVEVTWIGHASFLIRVGESNILIDPNWSLWLKGIKRLKQPGIPLHELPFIDLVLVTHAHFDHLDKRTLKAIATNQPIVVPFGVGDLVHRLGFHRVQELNYWESFRFKNFTITLTPCHHWGARVLHDVHRGFGGFVIQSAAGRSIFHCGDTAFFDGFLEIGKRFPSEIALLPIGAYDTPSGRDVHMNPEEAVLAFQHLGSRWLVPMHFGSFRLGFESMTEPPRRLIARAKEVGIEDRLAILEEGEPRIFECSM